MEQASNELQNILQKHKLPSHSPKVEAMLQQSCGSQKAGQAKLLKYGKLLLLLSVLMYACHYYNTELQSERCALSLPRPLRYALRPPEHCDFCAQLKEVPRLSDISQSEFESKYAYSAAPVIISDATRNWTAIKLFSYDYFQAVYNKAKRKQRIRDCQFLPYQTGFRDIYEALSMPRQRVELEAGTEPWYFGWSNCQAETAEEFRRHYGRPYFLPESSENNAVDWFFMGTAGLGAQMHIDNVRLPSWQAQLAGNKRWLLVPPPECYFQCQRFDVTVQQGDIIVLDTNKWYHQTFVQPGAVSLTIGAEYD